LDSRKIQEFDDSMEWPQLPCLSASKIRSGFINLVVSSGQFDPHDLPTHSSSEVFAQLNSENAPIEGKQSKIRKSPQLKM
jgi:hypothetical protein